MARNILLTKQWIISFDLNHKITQSGSCSCISMIQIRSSFSLSLPLLSSPPPPDLGQASQLQQVLSASPPPSGLSTIIFHLIYFKNAPWNHIWPHLLPHTANLSQGLCHTGSPCWAPALSSSSLNLMPSITHQHAKMTQQKAALLISVHSDHPQTLYCFS